MGLEMMHESVGKRLTCIVSQDSKVLGYLVVDSFVDGRSHGGVRMHPGITLEEISLLAHTMTLKYKYLGLPFGGAKAGVLGDPEAPLEDRQAWLAQFAAGIRPLLEQELFVPAADMGTEILDIRNMLKSIGIRFARRRIPSVDSGVYTAHSILAAARELAKASGFSLEGSSVAVEGVGKVGKALLRLLEAAGAKVVAVSTSAGGCYNPDGLPVNEILSLAAKSGSQFVFQLTSGTRIAADKLSSLPVDMLFLCAKIHSINAENVSSIQARAICPAANNPWPLDLEPGLQARGVAFVPDFVVNAGGILGTTMAYASFQEREICQTLDSLFGEMTRWLLIQSKRKGVGVRTIAQGLFDTEMSTRPPGWLGSVRARGFGLGLELHRRGLLPGALVRIFARPYFRRKMTRGLLD
jgi:glutamate dehydrogenase (NAD(P)+)